MSIIKGLSFPNMISNTTHQVVLSEDEDYIKQSLKTLVQSYKYELLGDPQYGVGQLELLFESDDQALVDRVKENLYRCISLYERNVSITRDSISIKVAQMVIFISIRYTIVRTQVINDVNISLSYGGSF